MYSFFRSSTLCYSTVSGTTEIITTTSPTTTTATEASRKSSFRENRPHPLFPYSTEGGTTEIITTTLPTTTTETYVEEITNATGKQTTIVENIEYENPIEEKATQTTTTTSAPTTSTVKTPFSNNTSATTTVSLTTTVSATTTVFPTTTENVLHENQKQDETTPFWRNFTIVLGTLVLILLIVVGLLMKTYLRYGMGYRDRYRVMCDNEHIRLI